MIAVKDIVWAAGFLEGEGSFSLNSGTAQIQCEQVQRQPLEKLRRLFGGKIALRKRNHQNPIRSGTRRIIEQPIYQWWLCGHRAAGVMMTIFDMLSPVRQEQVKKALEVWNKKEVDRKFRTHCPEGHPYDKENTIVRTKAGKLSRHCRTCKNVGMRKISARKRAA